MQRTLRIQFGTQFENRTCSKHSENLKFSIFESNTNKVKLTGSSFLSQLSYTTQLLLFDSVRRHAGVSSKVRRLHAADLQRVVRMEDEVGISDVYVFVVFHPSHDRMWGTFDAAREHRQIPDVNCPVLRLISERLNI